MREGRPGFPWSAAGYFVLLDDPLPYELLLDPLELGELELELGELVEPELELGVEDELELLGDDVLPEAPELEPCFAK